MSYEQALKKAWTDISNLAEDKRIVIEALEKVPILITLSRQDEEFSPDANILFDESIRQIFCTEDVVVLTEILTHSL